MWGVQQKVAPYPRIEGNSPQGSDVQVQDVFKEGSGVLASKARVQANESE